MDVPQICVLVYVDSYCGDTSNEESVISSSIPAFGKVKDSVCSCRDEVIEVGVAIEATLPVRKLIPCSHTF